MGLLLVLAVLFAGIGVIALGVHALRVDRGMEGHGWLVVVPLVIIGIWILQTWFMH
jgi:hypothetical protein